MRHAVANFFRSTVRPWGLLSAAVGIACFSTAVGFLGRLWWPFELAGHFRAQYFLFLAASATLFLVAKKRRAAWVTGAFALINLSLIVPLYFSGSPSAHAGARTYRALLMNVNSANQAYRKVRDFIRAVKPDLMVFAEVNQTWVRELQKTQAQYPFSRSLPRDDSFGIAIFSRIPLVDTEIRKIGETHVPLVVARFDIDGQSLTVIGVHVYSPRNQAYWQYRNQQIADLARLVSSQKETVLVLGDLNTTSWSPFFRDLLRTTGLRDSRKGFGVQPSWPAGFPPLWVPIDHCLVSSRVVVHNRRIGPNIGSDHYPVVVDFFIQSPQPFHVAETRPHTAAQL